MGKIRALDKEKLEYLKSSIGSGEILKLSIELIDEKFYTQFEEGLEETNTSPKLMELFTILDNFNLEDDKLKSYYLYYDSDIDMIIINKSEVEISEKPYAISNIAQCVSDIQKAIKNLHKLSIKDEKITFTENRDRKSVV